MYSDRRGTDKNHPGQNLPDKNPNKNLCELRQTPLYVCMHVLLKIGGGSEIVMYFGESRDV